MLDLSAIDPTFLTRFLFALAFYWVWGIASKGIFEPIQARIGQSLTARLNLRAKELKHRANSTCTEIDDFFIDRLAYGADGLDRLVNGSDLSPSDQRLFRHLVTERYKFSVLLKKLGLD